MTRSLALLAAAVAAIFIPAFAYGDAAAPGTIIAVDFDFENPATGDGTVAINPGETVTFSYPAGGNSHNIVFDGPAPSSCTQSAGTSTGAVPPLPSMPQGPGWAGTCRFNTAGTYTFVCGLHGGMTGTVTVGTATPTPSATSTSSPTPTATATSTPTATPTATATATPTATASPQATTAPGGAAQPTPTTTPAPSPGPAASRLTVARNQRGQAVRGRVTIARAGSRVKVEVLRGKTRAGSATKSASAGSFAFRIALNAGAKKALRRTGKLSLTVKVTVTPRTGTRFSATKKVTLKR